MALYDRDVRWGADAPKPLETGSPVIREIEVLETRLAELLGAAPLP